MKPILILLAVVLIIVFFILLPFIPYIATGAVIAYFLWPLYKRLSKFVPKRIAALGLIIVLGLIIGATTYYSSLVLYVELSKYLPTIIKQYSSNQMVGKYLPIVLQKLYPTILDYATSLIKLLPDMFLGIFIAMLSAYYFLLDGQKAIDYIINWIAESKEDRNQIINTTKSYLDAVIIGTIFGALAQAVVSYIGFLILNIKLALVLSILVFIVAILPIVGPSMIWVLLALYYFMQNNISFTIFSLVYGLFVVGLIDNIVRMFTVSSKADIHPLLAALSMIGGSILMGFAGLFLGPVLVGLALSLIDYIKNKRIYSSSISSSSSNSSSM
ncbi:NEQ162 [Nanoarchaeum equitans Kin4-M]|uniref:NEQ162 n=1 Tax=Nanoarchaeum equitans (strain Kin4-M) TaxID=228908 RepID=Q74MM7_NANEQ|nr:NEQ162 [Nanoarchaeum equitans Kin4-M]